MNEYLNKLIEAVFTFQVLFKCEHLILQLFVLKDETKRVKVHICLTNICLVSIKEGEMLAVKQSSFYLKTL